MKYFVKVLIVLGIAVALVFGYSFYYRHEKNTEQITLTTVHVSSSRESTSAYNRHLIAENKEADFKIYLYDTDVVFNYKGAELTYPNTAWLARSETPDIFYRDYDGDGKKDLLVRMAFANSPVQTKSKFVYNLNVFRVEKNGAGEKELKVSIASKNTWKNTYDRFIRSQMNQLESNPKFLQFVMDDVDTQFYYDEKTGISTNKHVYFIKAPKSNNEYRKLAKWANGDGIFNVDKDGNITCDILLYAYFENVKDPLYVGSIRTGITYNKGVFSITPKTIVFTPDKGMEATDPRITSDKDWSYTIENSDDAGYAENNMIDWVEADFTLDGSKNEKRLSFSDLPSQVKCVESIDINQDEVVLTSMENYLFLSSLIDSGKYAVYYEDENGMQIDAAYTCSIEQTGTQQKLRIKLDKKYPKKELKKIKICFGV